MYGGQLSGNGRINGDVLMQGNAPLDPADPTCRAGMPPGAACFTPGSSPGHMDITGMLTMDQGAVLELEIERDATGALHWDTESAGTMSFLQGSMIGVLIGDTAPGLGIETVGFLNCLTGVGDFSGASLTFGSDGSLGLQLAAVPEPVAHALLLAGLGVVSFIARRRRSRGKDTSGHRSA